MSKSRAVALPATSLVAQDPRSPVTAMRAAKLALLLTTAIAWGMTAQSVGALRTLGGGASRGEPVPELVREAPEK